MASDEGPRYPEKFHEYIDKGTFEQILEMDDDDEEREFSRGIVFGFFDQAKTTMEEMEDALKAKDLQKLSSLGHYLKGSSATLGLTKVKDSCEKIQNEGDRRGKPDTPKDRHDALKLLAEEISKLRKAYDVAEKQLKNFYQENA